MYKFNTLLFIYDVIRHILYIKDYSKKMKIKVLSKGYFQQRMFLWKLSWKFKRKKEKEIDELVPCLIDNQTGEIVETEVIQIRRKKLLIKI